MGSGLREERSCLRGGRWDWGFFRDSRFFTAFLLLSEFLTSSVSIRRYTPKNTNARAISPPMAATRLNTKQTFISLQPHISK